MGAFYADLDLRRLGPAALVEAVLEHYLPILQREHKDDAPKRERDLEQFAVLAERFESLEAMLADLALEPPGDAVGGGLSVSRDDEGQLVLSTIHSAKGLECHSVFVISALDGRLPSVYAIEDGELEEERRLLYVACTRAEENL